MATTKRVSVPNMNLRDMMYCDKVSQMQSIAMDGRISIKARILVRIHTIRCRQCRPTSYQFRVLRNAARRFERNGFPGNGVHLHGKAAERMRKSLRERSRDADTHS